MDAQLKAFEDSRFAGSIGYRGLWLKLLDRFELGFAC